MFSAWAKQIDRVEVRMIFVFIGIFVTIFLGPMAAFGAYMLATSLFSDAPDRFHFFGWGIVGMTGVVALIAAWLRVLVPSRVFRAKKFLRMITVLGLTFGTLVGALMFMGAVMVPEPFNPLALASGTAVVGGIFLWGATIGAAESAL